MNPNIELISITDKIALIIHKAEPRLVAEMHTETHEVTGLNIFSNGYFTNEINEVLTNIKKFINKSI